jgi:hypothetical protein
MSLSADLDVRLFQGLLTGLGKKNFYGESSISLDYLKEQVYRSSQLSPEGEKDTVSTSLSDRRPAISLQITEFEQILLRAADEDWYIFYPHSFHDDLCQSVGHQMRWRDFYHRSTTYFMFWTIHPPLISIMQCIFASRATLGRSIMVHLLNIGEISVQR